MTNRYTGGVISATAPSVSPSSASGVWNLEEAQYYQKAGLWPSGSGADPYFQNTTLLLHGDGTNGAQNNTFLDSSNNAFPITRNGNTTQGSFTPYVGPGCWSVFFNGSTDYLSASTSPAFGFGTGDFTVEYWIYASSWSTTPTIIDLRAAAGTSGFSDYITTGGVPNMYWHNTTVLTSTLSIPLNTWTHVAYTRASNTIRIFVNGALGASGTSSSDLQASVPCKIGSTFTPSNYFSGYLSNVKITKGAALYTAAFTPSTTPIIATSQTSLLTCNNSGFNDLSATNTLLTRAGSTLVSKFSPFTLYQTNPASYSGYFDGSGDYLSLPTSAGLQLGSSDFTFETWVYFSEVVNDRTLIYWNANTSGTAALHVRTISAKWAFWISQTGSSWAIQQNALGSTILANQWYHVAAVRSGTNIKLYINGSDVTAGGYTLSGSLMTTYTLNQIGVYNSGFYYMQGSLSNFRITNTVVYSGNFTPPTAPLTAISGTSLLTCQSTSFIDNSTNAFAITATGNAVPKRANPFTDTVTGPTAYFGTTYGGSSYFDGTSDYLIVGGSSNLAYGSNNFTIEMWLYPTANNRLFYDARPSGTDGPYTTLYINTSNQIVYYTQALDRIVGDVVKLSSWNHIALVRSGGTTRLYVNGSQSATALGDGIVYLNGASRPVIGTNSATLAAVGYAGYISNLRAVNGTAIYTTPFLPPAAPVTAVTNTQLLFNSTNAGIFDNTTINDLETVGSAQVSTSVVKYGTGSMSFNGLSDALIMPSQPAIAFNTGNFTVEGWVYFAGAPASTFHSLYSTLVQLASPGDHGVLIRASTTKLIAILQADNATTLTLTSTNNVTTGQWYHFALTRSGTTARLFLNGTLEASGTSSVNFYETAQALGRVYATSTGTTQYLNGYLDDVRVTNGVARYTANFTPPAGPFPNF
jgi:hypothetical protein